MYNLGIIPAAGKATRWGGVMKELMPIDNEGGCVIDYAYNALDAVCHGIVVVTSEEKIDPLFRHLKGRNKNTWFVRQQGDNDIWSAIHTALVMDADRYYFAMPDTVIHPETFLDLPCTDFSMGTFLTTTPERFGVLLPPDEVEVVNKQPLPKRAYEAWGALQWTRECRDLWNYKTVNDYTHAINLALLHFGVETWRLPIYHDLATLDDYMKYVHTQRVELGYD